AARSGRLPDQRRPGVRAAAAARAARAGRAGHRLQLAASRSLAHRHPAPRRRPDRGHRPHRRLPRELWVVAMARRLVNITLDNLGDLPHRCRSCVFWELDPVAGEKARETGGTELEKEAWISDT